MNTSAMVTPENTAGFCSILQEEVLPVNIKCHAQLVFHEQKYLTSLVTSSEVIWLMMVSG